MSRALFSHNPDLKRLRDEGYFVGRTPQGVLIMRQVPYVEFALRGARRPPHLQPHAGWRSTRTPDTHVVHWVGDFPCRADGTPIQGIRMPSAPSTFGHDLKATHSFSSKPDGGYADYHHKMTSYATIIAGPAAVLMSGVTPRTFRAPEDEEDSVFHYVETTSDRVGIGPVTDRLVNERVAPSSG